MKVLISADMEGTCGVVSWVHVMPPEGTAGEPTSQTEYERARLRMTREVNAAIEGALAGGADEVIVNDSHDGMRNLIPEELHPACRFISGNDKLLGMVQGVDVDGIGAVFYTGYHARAGTPAAPLAHTWTGWLNDVRFDGVSTGEFGINAAIAGHYGVPVTLVTGDDKAVAQTREFLGEQVVGVAVKEGISTFAALHLHPARAVDLIRDGARKAVAAAGSASPYVFPRGATVELEFDHQARADQAALCPRVERAGDRTIVFSPSDGLELCRIFRAVMKLASIRMSP
ncbi:MAG: M55 family metallopeptidase [Chloroflexia bacterium]|nr:M55 family metallopeptidase [Chloroflexia bacterium]